MKNMVLDVPTTYGGGLTILSQYYDMAKKDENNNWIFVVGKPHTEFINHKNITVLKYPKAKKNWVNRLIFDYFIAPRIAKKYKIDRIYSLQGTCLQRLKCEQYLYLQQSLFFYDLKCSIWYEPRIWFYKNVLSKLRKTDIKRATMLIVQTESSKINCCKRYGVDPSKFIIETPKCQINFKSTYKASNTKTTTFFYPLGPYQFKNLDVIIQAAIKLKNINKYNFIIYLTISGKENKIAKKWSKQIRSNDLPFIFLGSLSFNQMEEYYLNTILLFPSLLESFGLPLLEAKSCRSPIIVSDRGYAHDVLGEYDKVDYFDANSPDKLAYYMSKYIL